MTGESDLATLIAGMNPRLAEGEFVFCSLSDDAYEKLSIRPISAFRESEGTSVILLRHDADAEDLNYDFVASMIELQVHSSLQAVGFLAAIARELAQAGVSVNAVSAYYHDYLFVPMERASQAMHILEGMTEESLRSSR